MYVSAVTDHLTVTFVYLSFRQISLQTLHKISQPKMYLGMDGLNCVGNY